MSVRGLVSAPAWITTTVLLVAGCRPLSDEDQIRRAVSNVSVREQPACPPVPDVEVRSSPVSASLGSVNGDTAFASLFVDCAGGEMPTQHSTTYLMLRQHGKWTVVRPIASEVNVGL
jgi:hypothetical protein